MKRIVAVTLTLCMLLGLCAFPASAETDDRPYVELTVYSEMADYSGEQVGWFAKIIKDAAVALNQLMSKLSGFKKNPKELHELLIKVNDFEEMGDRLYMSAIRGLFTAENADPVDVLRWTEIYKRMERCCDACEHAADAVSTVLLKNS